MRETTGLIGSSNDTYTTADWFHALVIAAGIEIRTESLSEDMVEDVKIFVKKELGVNPKVFEGDGNTNLFLALLEMNKTRVEEGKDFFDWLFDMAPDRDSLWYELARVLSDTVANGELRYGTLKAEEKGKGFFIKNLKSKGKEDESS